MSRSVPSAPEFTPASIPASGESKYGAHLAVAAALPAPRLWRSRSDRMVAGVLGGLAEKWGVQPNFLRVLFAALSMFSAGFPGVLIYVLLWAITRPADAPLGAGRQRTGDRGAATG